MTHLMFGKIHAFPARADAVDQIWLNCCIRRSYGALPCGRPALFATRTKPEVLARSGNDQEREIMSGADDALGPARRSGALLRARRLMRKAPRAH